MGKTIFKWLILIFLFAYVTLVTVWAHGEARRHGCQGIEVVIAQSTTADTITRNGVLDELSRYPLRIVGAPVESLNTLDVERYLSRFSNFEEVNCILQTDRKLRVTVIPMIPALRVFEDGKSYYINKDGKQIESKANFFVDVPIVSGSFNETFTPRHLLPVTRFIATDPILSKLIGMIEAKDADNIILVPRIHGHVVNFGDTTRLAEKRRALLTVYRKVMPYKGWAEYDTISVKFSGQVVATRRKKDRTNHGGDYGDDIALEEATLPQVAAVGVAN
ncbi:MAG: hypothetical protein K2I16_06420 [Muribaculaceae bacterium]|nr:hypothetical protein [Muribaculaceae bacterium]